MHNLVDWRVQLALMRRLRNAGQVRYVGITYCTASSYPEIKAVPRTEMLDFLRNNHALVNRPFGSLPDEISGAGTRTR